MPGVKSTTAQIWTGARRSGALDSIPRRASGQAVAAMVQQNGSGSAFDFRTVETEKLSLCRSRP